MNFFPFLKHLIKKDKLKTVKNKRISNTAKQKAKFLSVVNKWWLQLGGFNFKIASKLMLLLYVTHYGNIFSYSKTFVNFN